MGIKGIDRILISVEALDESVAFFRDWVGMKVVANQSLDSAKIQQQWDLPIGTTARAAFLKNDDQPSLLELIEFQPGSDKTIRSGAKPWDYPLYHFAFYVKDMDKTYQTLLEKGYKFLSPPLKYSPFPPGEVKEVFLIGPDDIFIVHVERLTPPIPEIKRRYGKILETVLVVENIENTIWFYHDILGIPVMGDINLPTGVADQILHLPPQTDIRFVIFKERDDPAILFAAIKLSVKGKILGAQSRPPRRGLFAVSCQTHDLSGIIEKCRRENVKILSEPVELEVMPYGNIKAITVEGPNTELIEIFQNI